MVQVQPNGLGEFVLPAGSDRISAAHRQRGRPEGWARRPWAAGPRPWTRVCPPSGLGPGQAPAGAARACPPLAHLPCCHLHPRSLVNSAAASSPLSPWKTSMSIECTAYRLQWTLRLLADPCHIKASALPQQRSGLDRQSPPSYVFSEHDVPTPRTNVNSFHMQCCRRR